MKSDKQTVWLVTMLSLMVVLAAYLVVSTPIEPVGRFANKDGQFGNLEITMKEIKPDSASDSNSNSEESKATSNYFVGYQLQRNTLRSKMTEEYMKQLANPKAAKEERDEATKKVEELTKVDKKEQVLEELIRNDGYRDVVVMADNKHVDVIVQSDKLSSKQVVNIVTLVQKQLDIDSTNISIRSRA